MVIEDLDLLDDYVIDALELIVDGVFDLLIGLLVNLLDADVPHVLW